nr:insulin receptor substrate 2 [Pelodiscus sinensis]|eukprot:XP_006121905.1 insulin receptor substrate 2 [Pelodiscus sinensis]
MCRETSAGFQNGLNYIAIDVVDGSLSNCDRVRPKGRHALNGDINGVETSAYASIDFLSHNLKEATAVKGLLLEDKSYLGYPMAENSWACILGLMNLKHNSWLEISSSEPTFRMTK